MGVSLLDSGDYLHGGMDWRLLDLIYHQNEPTQATSRTLPTLSPSPDSSALYHTLINSADLSSEDTMFIEDMRFDPEMEKALYDACGEVLHDFFDL